MKDCRAEFLFLYFGLPHATSRCQIARRTQQRQPTNGLALQCDCGGLQEMDGRPTNMVHGPEWRILFLPPFLALRRQLHFTLWRVHTTRTACFKPPSPNALSWFPRSLSCSKVITKYHARCSFFSAEALKEEGSCNMISHQKRTRACLRASASVPNLLFGVEGNKPCWSGSGLSGV